MTEKMLEELDEEELNELLSRISDGEFEKHTASDFFDTLWVLEGSKAEEVIELEGVIEGEHIRFLPTIGINVRDNAILVDSKKIVVTLRNKAFENEKYD